MITKTHLKITAFAASLALAGVAFGGVSLAQDGDDDGTLRLENVTIVEVVYISFIPGKRNRAMEIINDYFVPASEAAGIAGPLEAIHFDTGKWDMVLLWEMKGGFDDLMWYTSPDDLKWFAALVEIAGGEEEAQAIWGEYISYVASAHNEVAHIHNPEDGDE